MSIRPAFLCYLCVLLFTPFTFSADDALQPARVFITDSTSWETTGNAGGSGGVFAAHSSGGARPQTAEIIKTFSERCPKVVVNNKQVNADYIVVLDHEGGKSWIQHKNKVAVFNAVSSDSIVSKSTLSLGGSVQDACDAISSHWSQHSAEMLAARAKPAVMPVNATTTGSSAASSSSASPVQDAPESLHVTSTPDGADIYVDNSFVGNAPATLKLKPGKHTVTIKQAGYKDWSRDLTADSGNEAHLTATLEK